MTTCMPSSNNFAYMFYGLLGEVGELIEKVNENYEECNLESVAHTLLAFGKVAKKIRKEPESTVAKSFSEINNVSITDMAGIVGELGDIAWMMNGIMTVLDLESEYVHEKNLKKLASRQLRGVIDGNGDNR